MYVEKPLTHDLAEGQAVIDAAEQAQAHRAGRHAAAEHAASAEGARDHQGRATRRDPQGASHLESQRAAAQARTSSTSIRRALDWKTFLGNAPEQPFDEYRFRNWRWFWDFGGGILTDLMVHWMDVANWFCDLDQPEIGRDDRRPLPNRRSVGNARHDPDAPPLSRTARCRSTSKGRSSTPATRR